MFVAIARVRFTRDSVIWEGWFTGRRYNDVRQNADQSLCLMQRITSEMARIWEAKVPSFNVDFQFPEQHHIVCKHLEVMFGNSFAVRDCDHWGTLGEELLHV